MADRKEPWNVGTEQIQGALDYQAEQSRLEDEMDLAIVRAGPITPEIRAYAERRIAEFRTRIKEQRTLNRFLRSLPGTQEKADELERRISEVESDIAAIEEVLK